MAEINIQRKKAAPSPWLLVLLLLLVLGAVAYFLFRPSPGPAEESAAPPATSSSPAASISDTAVTATNASLTDESVATMAAEEPTVTADELASFAAQTNNPDYGRKGLRMLSRFLIDLADREDLRDSAVSEKRDNLTSATSRLEETNASLRPGCVAAAALMQAMQQKSYPQLERSVTELNEQALQLSGRTTENDLEPLRNFFTKAAEIAQVLSRPAVS